MRWPSGLLQIRGRNPRRTRAFGTCIDPTNNVARPGEFRGTFSEKIDKQEQLSTILDRLENKELVPDVGLYADLIRTSTALRCLSSGIRIDNQISKHPHLSNNRFLANLLMQMYIRNEGSLERARVLSRDKSRWGVIMWTNAVAAYAQRGHPQRAIHLFHEMLLESNARPDGAAFVTALGSCTRLSFGKTIHACVLESEPDTSNTQVSSALMNMYARCGSLEDAREVFESVKCPRNVVMYTTMIAGYAELGRSDQVVHLFRRMQQEGVLPDKICFVATLNATDFKTAELVHQCVCELKLETNTVVATALINMYGKYDKLDEATGIFRKLEKKDTVAWNTMLTLFSKREKHKEVMNLFCEMNLHGVKCNDVVFISILTSFGSPEALESGRRIHTLVTELGLFQHSLPVGNAVVGMYGRCGSLRDSYKAFRAMPCTDSISWTSVCTTLVQHDECNEALRLDKYMQLDGVKVDANYFVYLLQACANLSAGAEGKHIHRRIMELGYGSDNTLVLGLINMYGKCGNLVAAKRVFEGMHKKDEVAWTTIIDSLAHHGHSDSAIYVFHRMQQDGSKPDAITLLCVLSACAHAGYVRKGCEIFVDIPQEYSLEHQEKHYGCLLDLIGRSGDLEAAESLMHRAPTLSKTTNYNILLSACKTQSDIQRGRRAAELIIELEPLPSAFVNLSNIYASFEGIDREPVFKSFIEVNRRVHEFVTGDKTHPRTREIYGKLAELNKSLLLKPVDEEHSEKLAICFGLLSGCSLRIVKSCRVCRECHDAIKLVSKAEGREIFIRDTVRSHHFKDGACSCGDYW